MQILHACILQNMLVCLTDVVFEIEDACDIDNALDFQHGKRVRF